jgi:Xaa-Pro aminopeptidase
MTESSIKLDKASKLANQKGYDGLIIYSDGPCVMATPSYFYYFAGTRPLGSNSAIILSKSGDRVLLVEPAWDLHRACKKSGISNTRGTNAFAPDLVRVMQDLKITGSVGVIGTRLMSNDLFSAISKQAKVEPAESITEEIAREKTKAELDNIRATAKIADIGFKAFLAHTKIGVREYELVAEIGYAMQAAGSEDCFNLVGSGKESAELHAPTNRKMEEGDIVIIEITPVCDGQFIQLCRTISLGKPSPDLSTKYEMLMVALKRSMEIVKPGVAASEMSRAMNQIISAAGYEKYCYPPYMRTRGHGLGVGSMSPGFDIDESTKTTFQKDQVVVVHPNQWLPGTGYLACGETVLVTDTGNERLSETETKLYVKE